MSSLMLSPHELDPARVLRLVAALGGACKRVLLVACEPLTFGGEEGVMGLSEIREIEALARCRKCGAEFLRPSMLTTCFCGSLQFERLRGEELNIKSIELEGTL